MDKDIISVIVPCFNEQESTDIFYTEFTKIMDTLPGADYELIFVDDGSSDNTLINIKKLAAVSKKVKFISFSKNFGKEAAIYAGLKAASGDYVCTMDVDLQDPIELLCDMYKEIKKGEYDIVAAYRSDRKGEGVIRSALSELFYKIINKISNTEFKSGARDFRLMTRQVADSVLQVSEYNRFSKGIMSWVGYKTKWLSFENVERAAGSTKWNFFKLFKYSLDAIIAFSTMPLAIASVLGLIFCLTAFIMIVVIIIKTLVWGDPVAGYPSMMCFMFLLSGVQLFSIGIIGQYLSKTYMEVKKRPIFIAKESNIDEI